MGNLFSEEEKDRPLADRIRPQNLSDVVGQDEILGDGAPLRKLIEDADIRSFIFWGPPGTGKTTVGIIISNRTDMEFVHLSAATTGVKEVREILQKSRQKFELSGERDLLFIDEIHRFNKAQQDVLLPFLEEGSVAFIGATTENPSFEINSAILSRCQIFVFKRLEDEEIGNLVDRACENPNGLDGNFRITEEARSFLINLADGDGRRALNILEMVAKTAENKGNISRKDVEKAVQQRTMDYDKEGEEHYNLISALHKTLRNSDTDAALYWLGRMLEGGEDPVYIARRLVRFASEDVGLADPEALSLALNGKEAVELIGMPECELALAQVVIYLSLAPKSNSVYRAYGKAKKDIEEKENLPVPLELRNAPTDLMEELGYGEDYEYAHDAEGKKADIQSLPDNLRGRRYYFPSNSGREKEMKEKLKKWLSRRSDK